MTRDFWLTIVGQRQRWSVNSKVRECSGKVLYKRVGEQIIGLCDDGDVGIKFWPELGVTGRVLTTDIGQLPRARIAQNKSRTLTGILRDAY